MAKETTYKIWQELEILRHLELNQQFITLGNIDKIEGYNELGAIIRNGQFDVGSLRSPVGDVYQIEGAKIKVVRYNVAGNIIIGESVFNAEWNEKEIFLFDAPGFDVASLTGKVEFYNLQAKEVIEKIFIKHNIQFQGTGGDIFASIGTETEPARFTKEFKISNSVSDDISKVGEGGGFYELNYAVDYGIITPLYIHLKSTNGDLNTLTAGEVEVQIKTSRLLE